MADLEEEARRRRERLKAMRAQMESGDSALSETSDANRLDADSVERSPKRARILNGQRETTANAENSTTPVTDVDETVDGSTTDERLNKPAKTAVFRSYRPEDAELEADLKRSQPKPPDITPLIQEHLNAAKGDVLVQSEDLTIGQLAPQKIDWDLKRDVSKKLARLELRTKRIIAEIVQERELARKEGVTDEGEA